jgi:hypothetical protein
LFLIVVVINIIMIKIIIIIQNILSTKCTEFIVRNVTLGEIL